MYYASTSGTCTGQDRRLVAVVNDLSPIISRKQSFVQRCSAGGSPMMEVENGQTTYTWFPTTQTQNNGVQATASHTIDQTYTVSATYLSCITNETVTSLVGNGLAGDLSLWMKDCDNDNGTAYTSTTPASCRDFCFNSPDIWLSATLGGTAIGTGSYVGNVTPHYMNVRVRNGTGSTQSGLLKVYWAKAGIAQAWISDWNNALVSSTAVPTGSVPAGDMIAHPIFISVPSNSTAVFSVPWVVPNPAWYAGATPGDEFHFCVVATIETGCNTLPSSTYLAANVQQSNKFSWKNFTVLLDWFLPKLNPVPLGNIFPNSSTFMVKIKSNNNVDEENVLDYADLYFNPSVALYNRWVAGGSLGSGFTEISNEKLKVKATDAVLDNLFFEADERDFASFNVEFTKQAPLDEPFYVQIMEYEEMGAKDSLIGGIEYLIIPPVCPTVAVEEAELLADPNCTVLLSVQNEDTGVEYKWYDNGGTLVTASADATVSTNQDTYFIVRASQNGCTINDTTFVDVSTDPGCSARIRTSIASHEAETRSPVLLIPNPANTESRIIYDASAYSNCEIIITNLLGSVEKRIQADPLQQEVLLDCSQLSGGIFLVSLLGDKHLIGTGKLIIVR